MKATNRSMAQLFKQIRNGDLGGAAELIELGKHIDLAQVDRSGQTCLHIVAGIKPRPEGLELAQLLLTKGAAVNAQDTNKFTALHLAAAGRQRERGLCLLKHARH